MAGKNGKGGLREAARALGARHPRAGDVEVAGAPPPVREHLRGRGPPPLHAGAPRVVRLPPGRGLPGRIPPSRAASSRRCTAAASGRCGNTRASGTRRSPNRRYRYLLDNGQTGLSVAFDLPTQMGYDSDAPMSFGEVGKVGVAIDSLEDMEVLFDRIPLGKVSTSMTINSDRRHPAGDVHRRGREAGGGRPRR